MIGMPLSRAASRLNARLVGPDVVFSGCSTDSRTIEQGNLFIALKGERFDGHEFVPIAEQSGASSLMLERDVSHSLPMLKVENTRKAMGLLAGFWRTRLAIPLVAITGSNGKTTVKEMVKHILSGVADVHATSGNLNNDIGVPITLFGMARRHQYAVIEMGANHPGEIEWLSAIAQPDVALITQCAPAHLEGFGGIEGVARAKAEIYSGLRAGGTAIINADDQYAEFWQSCCENKRKMTFAIDAKAADVFASGIETLSNDALTGFELVTESGGIRINMHLLGIHNVMNALAAAACCLSLGISLAAIKSGLEQMSAVKGRLQFKPGVNDSRFIDDTYNANPASLNAALDVLGGYQGARYLVLGDMGELGETAKQFHCAAGRAAKAAGVDGLYSIGELSLDASREFGRGGLHFDSVADLIDALSRVLNENTVVLVKGSRSMKMEKVVNEFTGGTN